MALEHELVREAVRTRRRLDSLPKPEVPRKGGVAVFNNANIAVPTGAWTPLTFNSERYDDAAFHSVAVNTSRLTVPTGYAGRYFIAGHFIFDTSALGSNRMGNIQLNGVSLWAPQSAPIPATWPSITVSTVYQLAVGDFVELVAYQDTGGNLNVIVSGNQSPELRMERVG